MVPGQDTGESMRLHWRPAKIHSWMDVTRKLNCWGASVDVKDVERRPLERKDACASECVLKASMHVEVEFSVCA